MIVATIYFFAGRKEVLPHPPAASGNTWTVAYLRPVGSAPNDLGTTLGVKYACGLTVRLRALPSADVKTAIAEYRQALKEMDANPNQPRYLNNFAVACLRVAALLDTADRQTIADLFGGRDWMSQEEKKKWLVDGAILQFRVIQGEYATSDGSPMLPMSPLHKEYVEANQGTARTFLSFVGKPVLLEAYTTEEDGTANNSSDTVNTQRSADTQFLRAVVHYDKRNYAEAIAADTLAIGLDPENAEYYLHRGAAYAKTSDYDDALADSSKAIQLEPGERSYALRNSILAMAKKKK